MYKTIRHGENSLQYTILPQNDDFRIEGKLTSAESSCSSGRKTKTKRPRRRSFFAYLGLLFVCTVIIGAVLIPFLVSADCLFNPTDWFLSKKPERYNIPLTGMKSHANTVYNAPHNNFIGNGNGVNIGKTVKIIDQAGFEKVLLRYNKTNVNVVNGTEDQKSNFSLSENLRGNLNTQKGNELQNDQKKLPDGNTIPMIDHLQLSAQNDNNGIEMRNENFQDQAQNIKPNAQFKDDRIKAKQQTEAQTLNSDQLNQNPRNTFADNPPNGHFVTEVRFEPVENVSIKPGVVPTLVVTTLRNQFINNGQDSHQQLSQQQQKLVVQSQTAPNVRPATNLSNSMTAMNNVSNPGIPSSSLLTRIIQVPLLKSAAKKPIIPPVLVKTNSQIETSNGQRSFGDEKTAAMEPPSSLDPQEKPNNPSFAANGDSDEVIKKTKAKKPKDWLNAHWPFVDSTTYFQWGNYKTEDSVLLPALLGFTLIGIIFGISVCLVARNKRTIVSSVRKRNRSASDVEQNGTEDNATLLTTASLSDED